MKFVNVLAGCLLYGGLVLSTMAAQSTATKVTFYTGGKAKVSLQPMAATLDYSLHFQGSTSLKTLILSSETSGGKKARAIINLDRSGNFNVEYLLREGPGFYKFYVWGDPQPNANHFSGLCYFSANATAEIPADIASLTLNDQVVAFADKSMGKTVGSGECWDLAQQALDNNGADWVRVTQFGKLLNPKIDEILPGDIIQFKSVKLVERLANGGTYSQSYGAPDHTSVVHDVLGPRHYKLAHQNVGGKRFVVISEIDFNFVTAGQYWIYRPLPRLLAQ